MNQGAKSLNDSIHLKTVLERKDKIKRNSLRESPALIIINHTIISQ